MISVRNEIRSKLNRGVYKTTARVGTLPWVVSVILDILMKRVIDRETNRYKNIVESNIRYDISLRRNR